MVKASKIATAAAISLVPPWMRPDTQDIAVEKAIAFGGPEMCTDRGDVEQEN